CLVIPEVVAGPNLTADGPHRIRAFDRKDPYNGLFRISENLQSLPQRLQLCPFGPCAPQRKEVRFAQQGGALGQGLSFHRPNERHLPVPAQMGARSRRLSFTAVESYRTSQSVKHDAPISLSPRSEEHTSELQSRFDL